MFDLVLLLFCYLFVVISVLSWIITRLIEIEIAPLTVLFCNYRLFCNCPLADLQLPVLKRYQFQYKVFVDLMWWTSNHMFVLGDFWDIKPSWFLKNMKWPSFYSGNSKLLKMHLGYLSQIALRSMWLLVKITFVQSNSRTCQRNIWEFKMLTFNSFKFNQKKLKPLLQRLRKYYVKDVRKNIFIKLLCERTEKLFIAFYSLHAIRLYNPYT